MAINKSGKYGSGKNRTNSPSAKNYKPRAADADARKFDSFQKVGGYNADPLMPDKPTAGIGGPSNSGNE